MDLNEAREWLEGRYDDHGFAMPMASTGWHKTAEAIRVLLDATAPERYLPVADADYSKAVRDAHAYLNAQSIYESEDLGSPQQRHLAWNSRRLARVLRVLVGRSS